MATLTQLKAAQSCSMATIRRAYNSGHWFDAATMRFFRTRLPRLGYRAAHGDAYYFVSSESRGEGCERRYSVREMRRDDATQEYRIDTRGGFMEYRTRAQADSCAYAYAMTSGAPASMLHGAALEAAQ